MSRRAVVAALLLSLVTRRGAPLAAGEPPAATEAVFADFGFDVEARRAVEQGEIAAIQRRATMEDELVGAAAMRLPVPPAEVATRLREGLPVLADRQISAWSPLGAAGDAWKQAVFGATDGAEVERLFEAGPGDTFNLSVGEIALLHARLGGRSAQAADAVPLASDAYREILVGRFRAYRARGAGGLDAYARAGGASYPGLELRLIGAGSLLPPPLQAMAAALDAFPEALPQGIDSRFYWKKTMVDSRPIFVLSHILVEEGPEAVRFALREYYPGHSYNVLQQMGVVVPVEGGSMMLAVNRTATDRVRGPIAPLARLIGGRRALDALRDYFVRMREVVGLPRGVGTETRTTPLGQ